MASSDLIQQIDDVTHAITKNPASSGEDNKRLLASAKRLVKSLESDEEKAWNIIMSVGIAATYKTDLPREVTMPDNML